MEPKAVAIVTCGNENAKELKKLLADTHYGFSISKWDLRNELTHYRAKDIAWSQDSNNAQTASAVYAISQFPMVAITMVKGFNESILFLQCSRGWARSHCVGKTVEALLNSMMMSDEPKYRAKLYSDRAWPIMKHLVNDAVHFLDNPFDDVHKVVDTSGFRVDEQWPFSLIHKNIEALHNFMTVWCELKDLEDGRGLTALNPPKREPPADIHDDSHGGERIDDQPRTDDPSQTAPPVMAPPQGAPLAFTFTVDGNTNTDADARASSDINSARDGHPEGIGPRGAVAKDKTDITPWIHLLDKHNVDGDDRRVFFLLAQRGKSGAAKANDILWHPQIKNVGQFRDASAYVHSMSCHAHTSLTNPGDDNRTAITPSNTV